MTRGSTPIPDGSWAAASNVEYRAKLESWDDDVPPRPLNRPQWRMERWVAKRWLLGPGSSDLELPIQVEQSDRPDLTLRLPGQCVAIEVTELIHKPVAKTAHLTAKDASIDVWSADNAALLPENATARHCIDSLGESGGWLGLAPEQHIADLAFKAVTKKLTAMREYARNFDRIVLLMYDNAYVPGYRTSELGNLLREGLSTRIASSRLGAEAWLYTNSQWLREEF